MVLGEDVGRSGGVFRATDGLQARFGPDRVVDTPVSEAAIIGASIGLATAGMVPVPELQFLGFSHQAFHQISHQLARWRYRTNGRFHAPVTIRAPYGGGVRAPELHSDGFEAIFAQGAGPEDRGPGHGRGRRRPVAHLDPRPRSRAVPGAAAGLPPGARRGARR